MVSLASHCSQRIRWEKLTGVSCDDPPQTTPLCDRGLGDCRTVSVVTDMLSRSGIADMEYSGSKFLKRWMAFLEEHADLRYPNVADLTLE